MASGGKRDGSGRPKGTIGKLDCFHKERIANADPISFLIGAFKGEKVDGEVLTYKERADVAQFLAKKIVPDLKAVEHTGQVQFDPAKALEELL